jgi:negative regulator of sigma E activity
MSNDPRIPNDIDVPEHLRESLSALIDGELSASESAFLLKRMQHDSALDAQWMRFQRISDALRGQAEHHQSKDFSQSVMAKIAALDPQPETITGTAASTIHINSNKHRSDAQKHSRTSWRRTLSGVGLAAAVAWGALMLPSTNQSQLAPVDGIARTNTAVSVTAASPVVGMHQVSGRIGSGFMSSSDPSNHVLLQQGMQRFMQQHFQQFSVQPTSQAAYLAPSIQLAAPTNFDPLVNQAPNTP